MMNPAKADQLTAARDNKFGQCPACGCEHWNQIAAHQHGKVTSRECDTIKNGGRK